MIDKIRIGVIGAGGIGRLHVDMYRQIPGCEVVAIADDGDAKSAERSAVVKVDRWFGDYRELLKLDEIDAVSVCTPNYLHCPVTVAALKAGKHVLCEKPMALNVGEAKRMVAAAKKAKGTFMMGFSHRFTEQAISAKKLVDAGKLGRVYHVRIAFIRRRGIPGLGGWFTTKKLAGGGPMLDIGVHFLDLAMFLTGFPTPRTVSAATHNIFGHRKDYTYLGMWGTTPKPGGPCDTEDLASAFLRYKNGMSLSIEVAWACNSEMRSSVELCGDKGGLKVHPELDYYGQEAGTLIDSKVQMSKAPVGMHLTEIKHFIGCIRTGKKPMATGEQGVYIQRMLDAVYRSAELGKEVTL